MLVFWKHFEKKVLKLRVFFWLLYLKLDFTIRL